MPEAIERGSAAHWPHLYRPGKGPVLLMLHGTGSSEAEIALLADRLDPAATVLAPRGRVVEHGATRWFRRYGEGQFDVDDVILRAGELADFIAWARAQYELHEMPVIAVGFSNGANIGLAVALLHPEILDRVIAFSGMYPLGERESRIDLVRSRFLVLNGATDPMAPSASVDRLVAELGGRNAGVERVTRSGGHGISAEELDAAAAWLRTNGAGTG